MKGSIISEPKAHKKFTTYRYKFKLSVVAGSIKTSVIYALWWKISDDSSTLWSFILHKSWRKVEKFITHVRATVSSIAILRLITKHTHLKCKLKYMRIIIEIVANHLKKVFYIFVYSCQTISQKIWWCHLNQYEKIYYIYCIQQITKKKNDAIHNGVDWLHLRNNIESIAGICFYEWFVKFEYRTNLLGSGHHIENYQ